MTLSSGKDDFPLKKGEESMKEDLFKALKKSLHSTPYLKFSYPPCTPSPHPHLHTKSSSHPNPGDKEGVAFDIIFSSEFQDTLCYQLQWTCYHTVLCPGVMK